MYKISVPIMNVSVNEKTRENYLSQLRAAKADRVFLILMELGDDLGVLDSFRENIKYFKDNGLEVGIWLGSTIGHGMVLVAPGSEKIVSGNKPLVNLLGEAVGGTHCPLDGEFRANISRSVAELARTRGYRAS